MTTAISMSVFERQIGRSARAERTPLGCTFEITPTCNLRCKFCYVAIDPYEGPYLTTAQVCTVLDRIADAGVLWLTLTGGEIFSRRDFPEIYAHARKRGFLVTLYSNGTMITDRIASLLAEHPPFSMEVSIYGADAEHYEGTTSIPGSFARFVRGIDHLVAAGVPLALKCPVSTLTQDHVPQLVAFARARGLPFKYDPTIDPRHSGGQEPTFYRIEPRDLAKVRDTIYELKNGRPPEQHEGPLPECSMTDPDATSEELYTCGAGRVSFFVDALGHASHCIIDREPAFPILEMPWEELWMEMGGWVTQPLPAEAPCSGCSLRQNCGNCPARSRLATGSPYLKDTYHCDVTHAEHGLPPAAHPDYRAGARPLGACVAG
jgi:radical SAM protein with 4Fe4S-binding SPASM domain